MASLIKWGLGGKTFFGGKLGSPLVGNGFNRRSQKRRVRRNPGVFWKKEKKGRELGEPLGEEGSMRGAVTWGWTPRLASGCVLRWGRREETIELLFKGKGQVGRHRTNWRRTLGSVILELRGRPNSSRSKSSNEKKIGLDYF